MFCFYDSVFVPQMQLYGRLHKFVDKSLLTNIIARPSVYSYYRPAFALKIFGFPEENHNIDLDISCFSNYYKDFKCSENTVVLNGTSSSPSRTYNRIDEVSQILVSKGFDVRLIDFSDDIRTNLHLLHQAAHVITTDTSTFWAAKAIGKKPNVFMNPSNYQFDQNPEEMLGTNNMVENKHYDSLDDIKPESIVYGFLNRKSMLFL